MILRFIYYIDFYNIFNNVQLKTETKYQLTINHYSYITDHLEVL